MQLSKMAADNTASPEVKQMAQRLVQDHTKANQELMTIAKRKDISVPKDVDDTHEDVVKLFSRLEGAQFDREFLRYQVMHHEKDVAAFTLQSKDGQDPDLKAFAAKQLPVLQEHLQQVRSLADQHTAGSSPGAAGQRGTR